MKQFVQDFSVEGFVNFASNLSDRAQHLRGPVQVNQHSDDIKEHNPVELDDHHTSHEPLGCKFATSLGAVVLGSSQKEQLKEAKQITSMAGINLPIDTAAEGIRIMQRQIPSAFSIHRGALHYAQTKSGRFTPIAIHRGHHAPNDQTKLVVDLAGYRSHARRHVDSSLPRYHHTPGLAAELLPQIIPEIKLEPSILKAAGLLLGSTTRRALSGEETPGALGVEVIPPEYSLQAA